MSESKNAGKYAEPALVVGGVRHKPPKEHHHGAHSADDNADGADGGVAQSRVVAGLQPLAQAVPDNAGVAKALNAPAQHVPHHEKPHAAKDKPPKQALHNIQQPR
jgi:hypothetical protein